MFGELPLIWRSSPFDFSPGNLRPAATATPFSTLCPAFQVKWLAPHRPMPGAAVSPADGELICMIRSRAVREMNSFEYAESVIHISPVGIRAFR